MTCQPPAEVLERVLSRVAMGSNGCHISTYPAHGSGYVRIRWREGRRRHQMALHRAVWQAARGPIPDSLTVDHVCHTRRCMRIDHLRLLTSSENARRNWGRAYPLGQSCPADHPVERRRQRGAAVVCLDCLQERSRAYRAAHPERAREAVRRYRAKRTAQN